MNIFHLDWLAITQWIVAGLMALVVFIKILQYSIRWGNVRAMNLDYTLKTAEFEGDSGNWKFHKKNSSGKSKGDSITFLEVSKTETRILKKDEKRNLVVVFTPLMMSRRRFTHMATALAEKSLRVVLIGSRDALMLGMRKSKDSGSGSVPRIQGLINHLDPETVIGVDFISRILMECGMQGGVRDIKRAGEQYAKRLWICIRPVLDPNDYKMSHRIPLSFPWLYALTLKISGLSKPIRKFKNEFKNLDDRGSQAGNTQALEMDSNGPAILRHDCMMIYPKWKMTSKQEIMEWMEKRGMNDIADITHESIEGGMFSFVNQETVVHSLICKKIDEFLEME